MLEHRLFCFCDVVYFFFFFQHLISEAAQSIFIKFWHLRQWPEFITADNIFNAIRFICWCAVVWSKNKFIRFSLNLAPALARIQFLNLARLGSIWIWDSKIQYIPNKYSATTTATFGFCLICQFAQNYSSLGHVPHRWINAKCSSRMFYRLHTLTTNSIKAIIKIITPTRHFLSMIYELLRSCFVTFP